MAYKAFPHFKQPDAKDCGPTCLRIIAKHYGKSLSLQQIRNLSETTREGSSLMGLSEAAESMGFKTLGVKINLQMLVEDAPLPCILHWNKNHFVVLYDVRMRDAGSWMFSGLLKKTSNTQHPDIPTPNTHTSNTHTPNTHTPNTQLKISAPG